jgi:hypothetical protein
VSKEEKYCKMPKILERTKTFNDAQCFNVKAQKALHAIATSTDENWKSKFLICIRGKKEIIPAGSHGRNSLTPPVYG